MIEMIVAICMIISLGAITIIISIVKESLNERQ
jgi:hypothetical protein